MEEEAVASERGDMRSGEWATTLEGSAIDAPADLPLLVRLDSPLAMGEEGGDAKGGYNHVPLPMQRSADPTSAEDSSPGAEAESPAPAYDGGSELPNISEAPTLGGSVLHQPSSFQPEPPAELPRGGAHPSDLTIQRIGIATGPDPTATGSAGMLDASAGGQPPTVMAGGPDGRIARAVLPDAHASEAHGGPPAGHPAASQASISPNRPLLGIALGRDRLPTAGTLPEPAGSRRVQGRATVSLRARSLARSSDLPRVSSGAWHPDPAPEGTASLAPWMDAPVRSASAPLLSAEPWKASLQRRAESWSDSRHAAMVPEGDGNGERPSAGLPREDRSPAKARTPPLADVGRSVPGRALPGSIPNRVARRSGPADPAWWATAPGLVLARSTASTPPPESVEPASAPVAGGSGAVPPPARPAGPVGEGSALQRAPGDPGMPPAASSSIAEPPDLDDLARRLYPKIRPYLRRELWLDRERAGRLTDLPW